jgi:hypothetical protein
MPSLRLFVRAAPFLLAAAAAVILLRRRRLARRARPAPPPVSVRPVPAPAGFERERAVPRVREPIDIVAVVDDLLAAGRS